MRDLSIIYNQNDPKWAQILLGGGPATIGMDGCYVTSYATVAEYYGKVFTPLDIVNFMIKANLFVNDQGQSSSQPIKAGFTEIGNDNTLNKIFGDIAFVETDNYQNIPADLNKLKTWLADPTKMVMVEIDLGGGNTHFAPVISCDGTTVMIANPWDGQAENFTKDYGDPAKNILKFVVYSGTPQSQLPTQPAQPSGGLPANYADIVHGSTQWDATVAKYLPGQDSTKTDFTALQQVVAGIQSTATASNNKVDQLTKDNAGLTQQVQNDEELLAEEQKQRQDDALAYTAQINALKQTQPNNQKLIDTYTGQISALQGQVKQLLLQKSALSVALAQAKAVPPKQQSLLEVLFPTFIKWFQTKF